MKTISHLLTLIAFASLLGTAACGATPARPTATPEASATPPNRTGTIAFVKFFEDVENDLYSIRTDGTGLTLLAHEAGANLEHPAWSPDGTSIAYQSEPGDYFKNAIWSMNADGTEKVRLTQLPLSGFYPTWSPDGKKIAFSGASMDSLMLHIYTMNADGSDVHALTSGDEMGDLFPTWAPDGKILFLRVPRHQILGAVFEVDPENTQKGSDSGLVQVTPKRYYRGYALSPDGKDLALYDYISHRIVKVPTASPENEVVLVDAFNECNNLTLSWSPDGRAVALGCSPLEAGTNISFLYIVNADGSGYKKIDNTGFIYDPDWRPE
jgi:Tol biopolymer transport system component